MNFRFAVAAAMLFAAACKTDPEPSEPGMARAVEGRSQQVLYAPARYALTPTYQTSVAGFRIEDRAREAVAAVLETTTDRLNLTMTSAGDFTSPVFAQNALLQLLNRVKGSVVTLLPLASESDESGDWGISAVESGITKDVYGNLTVYGRYRFEYKPIYRLRSIDLYRYMAAVLLRKDWHDYPADEKKYYASGTNALHFSLALSLHQESGYYTGGHDARRVGLSFGVTPDNKRSEQSWADLDDLVTFKTLGHLRDTLVEDSTVFEVNENGPAADFVIAIDRNGSLVDEAPLVRSTLVEFINRLATESGYDYHVALVTQGSTDFVRLSDGTRFISPASADPEALLQGALDTVLASADGATSVKADLMRTAAQSITAPAIGGVNKSFRRASAPMALVYFSDRDDRSSALDGSLIASLEQYITAYTAALRPFGTWIVAAPSRANCRGTDLASAEAAAWLQSTALATAGMYHDLCTFTPERMVADALTWGDQASSLFRFAAPQPLPFTLRVAVSGTNLVRDDAGGFTYDVLGDRLVFMPSAEPQAGDVVRASYHRFEVRRSE